MCIVDLHCSINYSLITFFSTQCFLGSVVYSSKCGKLLNVEGTAQFARYSNNMVMNIYVQVTNAYSHVVYGII